MVKFNIFLLTSFVHKLSAQRPLGRREQEPSDGSSGWDWQFQVIIVFRIDLGSSEMHISTGDICNWNKSSKLETAAQGPSVQALSNAWWGGRAPKIK